MGFLLKWSFECTLPNPRLVNLWQIFALPTTAEKLVQPFFAADLDGAVFSALPELAQHVTNGASRFPSTSCSLSKNTPPKTKMSTLKNNGWKTSLPFWNVPFLVDMLVFRGVFVKFTGKKKNDQATTKSEAFFWKLFTCIENHLSTQKEHPVSWPFNSCIYEIYGPWCEKHPDCGIW